jgi:hypothetical protein
VRELESLLAKYESLWATETNREFRQVIEQTKSDMDAVGTAMFYLEHHERLGDVSEMGEQALDVLSAMIGDDQ